MWALPEWDGLAAGRVARGSRMDLATLGWSPRLGVLPERDEFVAGHVARGCVDVGLARGCVDVRHGRDCVEVSLGGGCVDVRLGRGGADVRLGRCWTTMLLRRCIASASSSSLAQRGQSWCPGLERTRGTKEAPRPRVTAATGRDGWRPRLRAPPLKAVRPRPETGPRLEERRGGWREKRVRCASSGARGAASALPAWEQCAARGPGCCGRGRVLRRAA